MAFFYRVLHAIRGSGINRAVLALLPALSLLAIPYVHVCAQSKHIPGFDDLSTLKDLGDVQLSPDGKWLVYTSDDTIWLMRVSPGSRSRKIGSGTQPLWSPNSKRLAYYSGLFGGTQLWVFSVATGRSRPVTHIKAGISPNTWTGYIGMRGGPRYALSYSWSPDSSRLLFPSQKAIPPKSRILADAKFGRPLILNNQTPPSWTLSGIFRSGGFGAPPVLNGRIQWRRESPSDPPPATTNGLFIVDIRTRGSKSLTPSGEAYFNPDWSPDGKTIVCLSNEGRPLVGWGSGPTNLYLINASTGQTSPLTSDETYDRTPRWSPDGKWIAYLRQDKSFHQSLAIVSPLGGKSLDLTATLDRDIEDFAWSPDSESLFINYADGPSWPIGQVILATKDIRSLTSGSAYRSGLSVSDTGAIAWKQSDAAGQGRIYVLPSRSSSPYLLDDLNPQIRDWQLGAQEVLRWKNGRNEELEGILMKPPGYRTDQRYPLIVDCYPGLTNGFKGWAMTGNQAWAAHGYVVFWPTARAPNQWQNPYKAASFSAEARGPKGIDVMLDDVMSGIDELVREGIVDPGKIGLYGFSNGGGVLNQLIARTARFRCAISVEAGSSTDWMSDFFFYTYNKILAANAGVVPWEDPKAYVDLSVIFHLDKITTPMLIVEGDDDGMFLLNSIEMYNGLRWLDRDVTLLRYPGQGHGFTGAALKDFSQRVIDFFDSHLGQKARRQE
jgi:dipeptidyl aminopeptidase/acylaminoacyl peptidase